MKRLGVLTFAIILACANLTLADWSDIEPCVHYASDRPLFSSDPPTDPVYIELGNSIEVLLVDRLQSETIGGGTADDDKNKQWAQGELMRKLGSWETEVTTVQLPPVENAIIRHLEGIDDGISVIIMGDWDALHVMLEGFVEHYPITQISPTGFAGSEAYYIIAKETDVSPFDKVKLWLVADTKRSMNYAVISVGKALTSNANDEPTIESSYVVDYPLFERRYVGDELDLTNHGSAGPCSTSYYTPLDHAEAILEGSRHVVLENKGNGLIQYGDASYYESDIVSNCHSHSDVVEILTLLQNKGAAGWGIAKDYDWGDLGLDWITGTGLHLNRFGEDKSKWELASIEIEKKCRIELTGTNPSYKLVPEDSCVVLNWDFEDWTLEQPYQLLDWDSRTLAGLTGTNWTQGGDANNYYATCTLSPTDTINGLVQTIHVDNQSGIPAKHLFCEFDVRTSTSDLKVYFRHITDITQSELPITTILEQDELHRHLGTAKGTLPEPTSSEWQTVRAEFYTYGMQWDSLGIFFSSTVGGTVNVDNVKVYATPFYYVYLVDTLSEAIIDLYHLGNHAEVIDAASSNGNQIYLTETVGDDNNPGIHRVADFTFNCVTTEIDEEELDDWYATIRYHAYMRKYESPTFVNTLDHPPITYTANEDICHPEKIVDLVRDNMDWFQETAANTGNKIIVDGYFDRRNEQWGLGYSRDAKTLDPSSSYPSLCALEARFHKSLYDALQPNEGPGKPLFVNADMYNRLSNGRWLMRMNNPYDFYGFLDTLYVAPEENGNYAHDYDMRNIIGLDSKVVFVDWYILSLREFICLNSPVIDCVWDIFDEWKNVVGNLAVPSNLQTMFSFNIGDRPTLSQFDDRLADYALVAIYSHFNNKMMRDFWSTEHSGFTGGALLNEWRGNPDRANWQMYRDRIDYLMMWWNFAPYIEHFNAPIILPASSSSIHADFDVSPIPYPEDHNWSIDEVEIEYRIKEQGEMGQWNKASLSQNPSTKKWELNLNVPNEGGYVEFRIWALDSFGSYGSYPPRGTDPDSSDAGDSEFVTFERRLSTDINDTLEIWAPGILTQELNIVKGGLVIVRPLPGYKKATLYVTDNAGFNLINTGVSASAEPRVIFKGTDSTYIHIKAINDTTRWRGIKDSLGKFECEYAIFDKGTLTSLNAMTTSLDSAAIFDKSLFKDQLLVEGEMSIGGEATFAGIEIADSAHMTILAGAHFSFEEGTSIVLGNMSSLSIEGNDSMLVVLDSEIDSLHWSGILVDNNSGFVDLNYCQIKNATAGVLCDGTGNEVYANHAEFSGCTSGILAVNGGYVNATDCILHDNKCGLELANLSKVDLTDTEISDNDGSGISAFSRCLLMLEDCEVDSNQGDGLAGGVGLFTGSVALMKCTAITANNGPGITAYGGSVILSSADEVSAPLRNWRGNLIADNLTGNTVGQLNLKGRVGLSLINGHNSIINDSLNNGHYVTWDDQQGCDIWRNVYWGMIDTAAILYLLPDCVTLGSIDSSWSLCAGFDPDASVHDSLVDIFLEPLTDEFEDSLASAYDDYLNLIVDQQQSDYAFSASDRMLALNKSGYSAFSSTVSSLYGIADTTSDAELKTWLMNSIAWAWAEQDSIGIAESILDSLAQYGTTELQRISAGVQRKMLSIFDWEADTTGTPKTSSMIASIDSARGILFDLNVWDQYVITDSVVMYAPMRVDTTITIEPGGVLTILPHPGVKDPVVRFTNCMEWPIWRYGSITVKGNDTTQVRGKLYILGTSESRVQLQWDDQPYTIYGGIENLLGYAYMKHADFRGMDYLSSETGCGMTLWQILHADSCTFRDFTQGMYMCWMDSSSYIRNCTFESIGTVLQHQYYNPGRCVTFYASDNIEISNCSFTDNVGVGVYLYDCADASISNTTVTGGEDYGMLLWYGSTNIECSEISNNADTLAEIRILDGTLDLSGAHTIIADSSGPLIYSDDPAYVDLEDGENLFELYNGTDYYLKSGDTTQTWDITWNTWEPYEPDDPEFYDHLYPSNPAKWTVDSSLTDFLACGESAQSSIGGSSWLITPLPYHESATSSIDDDADVSTMLDLSQASAKSSQVDNKAVSKQTLKGPVSKDAIDASKSLVQPDDRKRSAASIKQATKADLVRRHHEELAKWREVKTLSKRGDKRATLASAKQLMDDHPTSKLVPAAMTKLSTLARQLGKDAGVSKYLLEKSQTLPDAKDRLLAKRLSYKAMAFEGEPKDALVQLESMMAASPTPRDSVFALVDAMQVYFDFHTVETLTPRFNNVKVESLPELIKRTLYLTRVMDDPNLAPDKQPVALPKEYKLYQNYPNPFNPSTEIKFDLPETVPVKLMVYNILGQHVVTLVDEVRAAGTITIPWDGKNAQGLDVATGMYVYQIKAGSYTKAKKMLLLR